MAQTTPTPIETTHSLESTMKVIFENKDEKKRNIFVQKVFEELCLIDNDHYLGRDEPVEYLRKSQTTFNFDKVEENYIIHKGIAFVNDLKDIFPLYNELKEGSHIISLGYKYNKNDTTLFEKPKVYSRGKDWWKCHNNKCDLFLSEDIEEFSLIVKED